MRETLTDEQVTEALHYFKGVLWPDDPEDKCDDSACPTCRMYSLAYAGLLEVQQSRQRRCGNCASYQSHPTLPDAGTCADMVSRDITPAWSCADWTPRATTEATHG